MILAADLGGTKTVLALFDTAAGVERPLHEETYPSREYDSLEVIVGLFLKVTQAKPIVTCFGVAGLDRTKVQWYAPCLEDILCCQVDFTVL